MQSTRKTTFFLIFYSKQSHVSTCVQTSRNREPRSCVATRCSTKKRNIHKRFYENGVANEYYIRKLIYSPTHLFYNQSSFIPSLSAVYEYYITMLVVYTDSSLLCLGSTLANAFSSDVCTCLIAKRTFHCNKSICTVDHWNGWRCGSERKKAK